MCSFFLGCTDALTAEFISDRTGEASISVTSKAKQLGTWRVSNYTPEYRETSGVGRRKLMTMDEVLRMDIDKALILIRGKNVLEVDEVRLFQTSRGEEAAAEQGRLPCPCMAGKSAAGKASSIGAAISGSGKEAGAKEKA